MIYSATAIIDMLIEFKFTEKNTLDLFIAEFKIRPHRTWKICRYIFKFKQVDVPLILNAIFHIRSCNLIHFLHTQVEM